MLSSVGCWLFTEVSGQVVGPFIKGQAVEEGLFALEDRTDKLSQNVGRQRLNYAA